jgi:hypothetical protein
MLGPLVVSWKITHPTVIHRLFVIYIYHFNHISDTFHTFQPTYPLFADPTRPHICFTKGWIIITEEKKWTRRSAEIVGTKVSSLQCSSWASPFRTGRDRFLTTSGEKDIVYVVLRVMVVKDVDLFVSCCSKISSLEKSLNQVEPLVQYVWRCLVTTRRMLKKWHSRCHNGTCIRSQIFSDLFWGRQSFVI